MKIVGRPCPNCGKKTLKRVMHPHAFGWYENDKLECRSCHKKFRVETKMTEEEQPADYRLFARKNDGEILETTCFVKPSGIDIQTKALEIAGYVSIAWHRLNM